MTLVDDALGEVRERMAFLGPIYEGLQDYNRLNILAPTRKIVQESIEDYSQRLLLLQAVEAALLALIEDGHPDIAVREIPQAAVDDLEINKSTIGAARAIFASGQAVTLSTSGGNPEPK
jgi:hypothetical protein